MSNYETSATLSTNAGFEATDATNFIAMTKVFREEVKKDKHKGKTERNHSKVSNENQPKTKPSILGMKYEDMVGNTDILLAIIKHLTYINGPSKRVLGKLCDASYRKFSFRQIKHQTNACLELLMEIYAMVDNEDTASTLRKLVKLIKNIMTSLDVFFFSIATVAKNHLQTDFESNIKLFHMLKSFDMTEFARNLNKLKKKLNTSIPKCQLKPREHYKLSLREVIPLFRLGALKFDEIINEEIRLIGYDHEKYVPKAENKSVKRKRGNEDSFEEDSEYQPSKVGRIVLYEPEDDTSDSSSDEEDIPFTGYKTDVYSHNDNNHASFVNEVEEVQSLSSTNEHTSCTEHRLEDISFTEHSNEIISPNKNNQANFGNEIIEIPCPDSADETIFAENYSFTDKKNETLSANESSRATAVNPEEPNDSSTANHGSIFGNLQIANDRNANYKVNEGFRRQPSGFIYNSSIEKIEKNQTKFPKNEFEAFKVQAETKYAIGHKFSLTERGCVVSNESKRPEKRKRIESADEDTKTSERTSANCHAVLKRVRLAISTDKTAEKKRAKKAAIPTKRFQTLRRVATSLVAMKRNFMGGPRIGKRGTVYPVGSE